MESTLHLFIIILYIAVESIFNGIDITNYVLLILHLFFAFLFLAKNSGKRINLCNNEVSLI